MKFTKEIENRLKKEGFEITCQEENIWVLEKGESSITISGDDKRVEAIWQDFDGNFDDNSGNIDDMIEWSKNMLGD